MFANSKLALVALFAALASAQNTEIGSRNPLVAFSPTPGANSWTSVAANGAYNNSGAAFLLGQQNAGVIHINPTDAFTSFQFYGYQRPEGGIYEITFDGAHAGRINIYNKTATDKDAPVLLFHVDGLPNAPHKVLITNLKDARVNLWGMMNFDHAVISVNATPAPPASAPPAPGTPAPKPPATPAPAPPTTPAPAPPASTPPAAPQQPSPPQQPAPQDPAPSDPAPQDPSGSGTSGSDEPPADPQSSSDTSPGNGNGALSSFSVSALALVGALLML